MAAHLHASAIFRFSIDLEELKRSWNLDCLSARGSSESDGFWLSAFNDTLDAGNIFQEATSRKREKTTHKYPHFFHCKNHAMRNTTFDCRNFK